VNLELVNTGSELMLGRVLNTHQQWLCRQLADRGWTVTRQVAVPDTGPDILGAVREALTRSDLVLTTGGLGPTSDDITRDLIAELLQRPLHEDASVLENIRSFFTSRNRPMPERTRLQALVPEGATVIPNAYGTAPGLAMHIAPNPFRAGSEAWLIMLPGPPRELRPMFSTQVLPLLHSACPPPEPFTCLTLRSTGVGESVVEERIAHRLDPLLQEGLELGYCARSGEVDVRLAARGPARETIVRSAERIVREQLDAHLYGTEDDTLEAAVIRTFSAHKLTLSVAESCTGGLISHRLTNVPGASAVFLGGCTTYADRAKQHFLGVPADLIAMNGAVSEPVARAMAEGARKQFATDYAVSVTGIAGPGGGSDAKPVGTVFLGLAGPAGTRTVRAYNPFDRGTFKLVTSQQALEMLRRAALPADS
jgi:nicotinamide-nucleotide amidase